MGATATWVDGIATEEQDGFGSSPFGYDPPAPFEILAEADWAGSYEFEMLVVWRNSETGELRAAVDSGCSCPTPFADLAWEGMREVHSVDDLRALLEHEDSPVRRDWDATDDERLAAVKAAVHRALRTGAAA